MTIVIRQGALEQLTSMLYASHLSQTTIIVKKAIHIDDLHFEHENWQKELSFMQDEVNVFENRLEEIVQRNTGKEVLAEAEHFQNQFIRQKEVIDTMKHNIKLEEEGLAKYAKEHPVAIDHVHFDDHTKTREEMHKERVIFAELKNEYYRYLSKYM